MITRCTTFVTYEGSTEFKLRNTSFIVVQLYGVCCVLLKEFVLTYREREATWSLH